MPTALPNEEHIQRRQTSDRAPKKKVSSNNSKSEPTKSVVQAESAQKQWDVKHYRGIMYGCPYCKFCSKYSFTVYPHIRRKHAKEGKMRYIVFQV